MKRRQHLGMLGALAMMAGGVRAAPALREMQVYKLNDLKLEVWVENQPPWTTELSMLTGHPTFVAQSPDSYHPPTVMTYASWPDRKSPDNNLHNMAVTAIRTASLNFGLNQGQARGINPLGAEYGVLRGYEATFDGMVEGTPMDVTVFIGQAPGRFPVALTVYTLRGKSGTLTENRRRSWGKLKYL
ncbi:hypothetical protein GJ699_10195 [Duganella sp. FT80W]|uniref:Uncharacterized protein n=1 Tax=Duganella guangzhouensis TaxID=2666084 RepID=A0A6I2L1I4_9BURK|nr:hypothetical protein [Duganella guangzhouensis]MRW90356.1 hypothetical protein [Duganella guangzhouensis]